MVKSQLVWDQQCHLMRLSLYIVEYLKNCVEKVEKKQKLVVVVVDDVFDFSLFDLSMLGERKTMMKDEQNYKLAQKQNINLFKSLCENIIKK